MKSPSRLLIASAAVALAASALVVAPTFSQGPRDPQAGRPAPAGDAAERLAKARENYKTPTIATVDTDMIREKYVKFRSMMKELEGYAMELKGKLGKLQAELSQKEEELKRLAPGSGDAKRTQDEMIELQAKVMAFKENANREMQQRYADVETTLYNETQRMVEAIARRLELTLVVRASRDKQVSSDNPEAIVAAQMRAVIYADPKIDITDYVISNLNKNYEAAMAKSPGAAGARTQQAPPRDASATPASGGAPRR